MTAKSIASFLSVHNFMDYKDLYKTAVDLINKKKKDNPDFNLQEQTSYCVIATVKENIYIGTNGSNIENGQLIRTCSEYEAVNAMMRKGENKISAMVSVDTRTLKPVLPCEKCRNLIIQINDENTNMNVMKEDRTFTTLGELMEAQPIKIDEIGESLNIPKKAYTRPSYTQFATPQPEQNNVQPVSKTEEKTETVQVATNTSDSDDMWDGWDSGSSQVDNGFGKWEAPKVDEQPAQPQYNSVYGNNPMPQNPVNPQPQYGSVYGNPVPQNPVNPQPQYGSVYGNNPQQQYGSVYGNPMPQNPVAQQPQYGSVYGNPIPQTPVTQQPQYGSIYGNPIPQNPVTPTPIRVGSVYGTPTSQSIYGSLHGNSGSIPIPGRTISEDEEDSLFKQRLSNIMGDTAPTASPASSIEEKEEKLSKEELKQLAKEKKKRAKTNAKFLKSAKKKGLME